MAIRDLTVAAPLKPGDHLPRRLGARGYPRPDGRGPIEAPTSLSSPSVSCGTIRDLTVAGPIEATSSGCQRTSSGGTIRDLTVAAPLKPESRKVVLEERDELSAT